MDIQFAELHRVLFDSGEDETRCPESSRPPIFRIPECIHKLSPSAYTPQLVPVGPFYSDDKQIKKADEEKLGTARQLLFKKSKDLKCTPMELLNNCLARITENISNVRGNYKLSIGDMGDKNLVKLMLLDGLFIVHVLLMNKHRDDVYKQTGGNIEQAGSSRRTAPNNVGKGKEVDERKETPPNGQIKQSVVQVDADGRNNRAMAPFGSNAWTTKLICYDLLKVENQIPWIVLELLRGILYSKFDSSTFQKRCLQSLINHMDLDVSTPTQGWPNDSDFKPVHLLDLFREFLVRDRHALEHEGAGMAVGTNADDKMKWSRVPRAVKLQRAAIKFRKRKSPKDFLDINFHSGVLEIPHFRTTDYTRILFRNLIAYEQLRPDSEGACNHITAYIVLLDCLVDTEEDVSLLQCNGIIENRLNSDQAAADLLNNLKHHGPYALDGNCLSGIFLHVNQFYKKERNRQCAILMRDYCGDLWKVIGLLVGFLLLALTALQTFYTVYAYYRPRH